MRFVHLFLLPAALLMVMGVSTGCIGGLESADLNDMADGSAPAPAPEPGMDASGGGGSMTGPADASPGAPDATPAPGCDWPGGAAGTEVGEVVPESVSWQGFGAGDEVERRIAIGEFFDCDGELGYDALLVITSQYGCPSCDNEASGLTAKIDAWAAEGLTVKVVTLLLEDPSGRQPATIDAAETWRDRFTLTNSAVAFDNSFSMIPRSAGGSIGTPYQTLINPRTMEIVNQQAGYDPSYTELLRLARANEGM